MPILYLETSAFIKEFSEEAGSLHVRKILEACEAGKLMIVTSQWTIGETLAAIDRKFRRREINIREKEDSMLKVIEVSISLAEVGNIKIIPVREELVRASWKFIDKHHLSADDSLHLLSSIVGLSEIFVAADEHLLSAVKAEGLEAYNVENRSEATKLIERLRLD